VEPPRPLEVGFTAEIMWRFLWSVGVPVFRVCPSLAGCVLLYHLWHTLAYRERQLHWRGAKPKAMLRCMPSREFQM